MQFLPLFVTLFLFLLVLILLDVIAGAVRSLLNKEFEWEKLPGFLITAGAYLFAWLLCMALVELPIYLGVVIEGYAEAISDILPEAVYALIVLKYLASLVGHVRYFIGYEPKPVG